MIDQSDSPETVLKSRIIAGIIAELSNLFSTVMMYDNVTDHLPPELRSRYEMLLSTVLTNVFAEVVVSNGVQFTEGSLVFPDNVPPPASPGSPTLAQLQVVERDIRACRAAFDRHFTTLASSSRDKVPILTAMARPIIHSYQQKVNQGLTRYQVEEQLRQTTSDTDHVDFLRQYILDSLTFGDSEN